MTFGIGNPMNAPPPATPPVEASHQPVASNRIRSPSLSGFLAYWTAKGQALGRMPARQDLLPEEMAPFLPFVSLIDVRRQPPRFRFRRVGTGIVGAFGSEPIRRLVDEDLFGAEAEDVERFLAIPLQTHGPAYAAGTYAVAPTGRELDFEILLVPLSTDGQVIDMLLGGLIGQALQPEERLSAFRYDVYGPVVQTAAG
jgi:hypothetical protein